MGKAAVLPGVAGRGKPTPPRTGSHFYRVLVVKAYGGRHTDHQKESCVSKLTDYVRQVSALCTFINLLPGVWRRSLGGSLGSEPSLRPQVKQSQKV